MQPNDPILVNYNGGNNTNMEFFVRPDTDIYHSCSAPLNGEYYVFGGYNQAPWPEYDFRKQIRRDFKLMLASWSSQPIKKRI